MLTQFETFVKQEQLFTRKEKVLVAVSGGKDSMALVHYLHKESYAFIVGHCNFQLRGAESDADASFVKQFCMDQDIPFFEAIFDTTTYAKQHKISIQVAARELRYKWLEELRKEQLAKVIVTAHHLDDNIETLLFNLSKGTGLKGLRGMLPRNGNLVRPMLAVDQKSILAYVAKNKVVYREDSSNASLKYDRNKIRQKVLPVLQELNPNLKETFNKHFDRWRDMEILHNRVIQDWQSKLFKSRNGAWYIAIASLTKLSLGTSALYELFQEFGFNNTTIEDLKKAIDMQSETKQFSSATHRILKDRKFLILSELEQANAAPILIKNKAKKVRFNNSQLIQVKIKPINKLTKIAKEANHFYMDVAKLKFPLVLRRWEPGDYFYPIGFTKASGKPSKKNLGKFLRDLKIDAWTKENTWVLSSEDKIVWVVGFRGDDRFKIDASTKEVLCLELK